ncbi:hypothetical protein CcrC1_gp222c [Caulobacter phage C1]|nr:hypothetical protein CcrC1_gp222c [Caulobacter phage C1]UTU08451.1 hypothetical protein CcrC2_gp223c [Caulobacter phage C2]UTU08968.1 hypothetical protein CcrJ4_gp217c [Caulobacter phage J4]UTU10084.1 hypothetical protein CcrRB23_gp222c [Caulobacter phage RB23]WGN97119.1 hypothetical protein [Bertelyvirus sp.]
MTREEARDAVMAILFEEAPNSPRYMGNGGPEIVADMILDRLAGSLCFTRVPRPQTSVWLAVSYDEADDVYAIRRIVKGEGTDEIDAWVDTQPKHLIWYFFQFWVDAETLAEKAYVLVELDGPEDWSIDSLHATREQAEQAKKDAEYEWGANPSRPHYFIDEQPIAA